MQRAQFKETQIAFYSTKERVLRASPGDRHQLLATSPTCNACSEEFDSTFQECLFYTQHYGSIRRRKA